MDRNTFENKVVVITGGARGIGKCIAEEFSKKGAKVCVIDTSPGPHYVGDIGDKSTLEDFAKTVISQYSRVDVLVNNAPPSFLGIDGGQTRLMIYHGDHGWTLTP